MTEPTDSYLPEVGSYPDNADPSRSETIRLAQEALPRITRKHFDDHLVLGRPLSIGRNECGGKPNDTSNRWKGMFHTWLIQHKLDKYHERPRMFLLRIMDNLPEVLEWRETLKDEERAALNYPVTVWNRFEKWRKQKQEDEKDENENRGERAAEEQGEEYVGDDEPESVVDEDDTEDKEDDDKEDEDEPDLDELRERVEPLYEQMEAADVADKDREASIVYYNAVYWCAAGLRRCATALENRIAELTMHNEQLAKRTAGLEKEIDVLKAALAKSNEKNARLRLARTGLLVLTDDEPPVKKPRARHFVRNEPAES